MVPKSWLQNTKHFLNKKEIDKIMRLNIWRISLSTILWRMNDLFSLPERRTGFTDFPLTRTFSKLFLNWTFVPSRPGLTHGNSVKNTFKLFQTGVPVNMIWHWMQILFIDLYILDSLFLKNETYHSKGNSFYFFLC